MPDPTSSTPAARPRRPWRDNLEAFGVAILAAVLLKPMVIEAYQIPTPSMQPTLMGSPVAGIYDRILVDKIRYELFEPKRWDIVVFRYPIRRNQNYVKRIVGVGGDRLRIRGGNVWLANGEGEFAEVLRKPERIQAGLWKEIYPLRREVEIERGTTPPVLGKYFEGQVGSWREEDGNLIAKTINNRARIAYTDVSHNGLCNQLYDGYAAGVAALIQQDDTSSSQSKEGVQDVRAEVGVRPSADLDRFLIELRLQPAGHPTAKLQLQVEGGKGTLRVVRGDDQVATSEPFDCAFAAGETTPLAFSHLDDRLMAYVDGEQVAELEVGEHRVLNPLEPRQVSLLFDLTGGGEVQLSDVTLARDLHYVDTGLTPNQIVEVPDGHFFMMGDNTLASADSRQWEVITVGVTDDGWMVDPARADDDPSVRRVQGNKRPWDLNGPPDVDENPVIVRSGAEGTPDLVAFTDDNGEVLPLKTKLGRDYDPFTLQFDRPGGGELWTAPARSVHFVPREHVLGRPVLGFWPVIPFRLGFIR